MLSFYFISTVLGFQMRQSVLKDMLLNTSLYEVSAAISQVVLDFKCYYSLSPVGGVTILLDEI